MTYRTSLERRRRSQHVLRLGRRERVVREIEALKNVSFEVPHGKVLGVVGANGAGKSTLMRTVAGILPPTAGRVEVRRPRQHAAGARRRLQPELTGRENVVLGGLAAGLTREQLAEKYDEIVEFAELEEFMDMPMRTYSSGMYGRLAFSVAVNMDPDILIIDEALSVGDARFRRKSSNKMRELCGAGPHDRARQPRARQHRASCATRRSGCDQGELRMWDEPSAVIEAYTEFLGVGEDAAPRDRKTS